MLTLETPYVKKLLNKMSHFKSMNSFYSVLQYEASSFRVPLTRLSCYYRNDTVSDWQHWHKPSVLLLCPSAPSRSDSYCSAVCPESPSFSLYRRCIIHSSCPICSISYVSVLSAPQWAIRRSSDSCAFVHLSITEPCARQSIFSA